MGIEREGLFLLSGGRGVSKVLFGVQLGKLTKSHDLGKLERVHVDHPVQLGPVFLVQLVQDRVGRVARLHDIEVPPFSAGGRGDFGLAGDGRGGAGIEQGRSLEQLNGDGGRVDSVDHVVVLDHVLEYLWC